jgi:flagellar biogenesis protein FliO
VAAISLLVCQFPVVAAAGGAASAEPAREGSGIDEAFFREGGPLDAGAAAGAAAGAGSGASGSSDPAERSDAAPSPSALEPAELAGTAGRVIGALAFVSLLIVGIHKVGKKAKLPFLAGDGYVRRIAIEPIGPNQYIQLVEIGGRVIVLGLWDKGMTKLTELDGEALDRVRLEHSRDASRKGDARSGWFGHVLRSVGGYFQHDPAARRESASGGSAPFRDAEFDPVRDTAFSGREARISAGSAGRSPVLDSLSRERRRLSEMSL